MEAVADAAQFLVPYVGEELAVPALAALVLGGLLALLLLRSLLGGGGKRGNTVLFVGLPTAGKTALFFRLLSGASVDSHTSMQPNERDCDLGNRALHFVDFPGHGRLREGLARYFDSLLAIVYVIDACDIDQTLSDNASFLVDLMTNPRIVMCKRPPQLAIVCTKRDLGHSYKCTAVRKRLEKEIDEVRRTKASSVGQMGETGEQSQISLGMQSDRFDFGKHSSLPTTFMDCAVKDSAGAFFTGGVDQVREWLAALPR
eukprot:TRINITY_DN4403_c2_g1_i1.p1 TRINITY_DN4403_c2_g1~~TRINITY_DN4403_c2_g1_i1.p1  ORF type:complete len:258 (+),score=100.38 TRINITY_DN4403_c2_g1_i1:74-847(+)